MKGFRTLAISLALMSVATLIHAREDRGIFITAFNAISDKAAVFKPGGAWFPYPAYSDRKGWDELTGEYRDVLIKNGERFLDFKWTVVPATAYLEYEKVKDRGIMRKYDLPNREALAGLTLAELAEGKGRFLPQIINGVYYAAERTTWNHAQHTVYQYSGRTLPVPEERVVTLLGASYAMNVAIAWHFFHEAWDKFDPSISETVLNALEINTFRPYMERDWWWMGFDRKNGGSVNNWNCHCNFFCTLAFLLADRNPERLVKAVERSLHSFDQYMDYVSLDGACEEGPGYWTMAGGKVYDYARMMCDASGGAIDMLKDSQVRKMGEFMVSSYIGDGWQLDFGDGDARQVGLARNRDLFLRFGHDTGSEAFENLGLSQLAIPAEKKWDLCSVDTEAEGKEEYRALEVLRAGKWLEQSKKKALEAAGGDWNLMVRQLQDGFASEWYPETQVAMLRNAGGWYLGAKAGNNGESHGHHDIGSALVFVDRCPVFVDPGVGTYVKSTFGPDRYTLWGMQTEWHNLPLPNGCTQGEGSGYKASEVFCDKSAGVFRCDIAGAWPEEAGLSSWVRTYTLGKDDLTISDSYRLKKRLAADDIHFVTPARLYLPGDELDGRKVKPGEILILTSDYGKTGTLTIRMTYPAGLTPSVEKKVMDDSRFILPWGEALYKLTFRSPDDAPLSASYKFIISRAR